MTIGEKNIVKRWELMASKDLGCEVVPKAAAYAKLFRNVFEGITQFSTKGLEAILPELRGFCFNNERDFEACDIMCNVVECLDLSYINMDSRAAEQLDSDLFWEWHDRYTYALAI